MKIHESHCMGTFSDVPYGCKQCASCSCHSAAKLELPCTQSEFVKEVPVTINFDMDRKIGTARVFEDTRGLRVEMKIHDEAARAILMGEELTHLSIDTAHFVRDKDKERRLPWQS